MIHPTQWGDIITHGDIPILCHNTELQITWCNSAATKILNIDGIIGKSLFDLSTSDSSKIPKYHRQMVTKRKNTSISLHVKTSKGNNIYIIMNSTWVVGNDEECQIVCHIKDDTRRIIRENRIKMALEYTKEIYREKTVFISKVLHEIRTPVNNLMLIDDSDEFTTKCIKVISRKLTNLSYALKFDNDKFLVPDEKPVSLSSVIRTSMKEASSYVTGRWGKGMIDFQIYIDGDKQIQENEETVIVEIDEHLIQKVLTELIVVCNDGKNKIEIIVDIDSSTDVIKFSISKGGKSHIDTGAIHESMHTYWLEPHEKEIDVKQSLIVDPGFGLGLNVCNNILQSMHTRLNIERDFDGVKFFFSLVSTVIRNTDDNIEYGERELRQGSTQSIWTDGPGSSGMVSYNHGDYPESSSPSHTSSVTSSNCTISSSSGEVTRHILVTDDNVITRKLCSKIITELGHTCETASNGATCVEMVASKPSGYYDLIFMDIRMPLMNGIDATRAIKQDLKNKVPIIGFTAENDSHLIQEAINCGMYSILPKPVSPKDIKIALFKKNVR